jgi:drug/metabolite transporter (DMT)-like permease
MPSRNTDGRPWILLAAVLWSLSGIWTKSLPDDGMTIAVWRSFFAGAVLAPMAKGRGPGRIGARYFVIALAFASMIGLYIGAIKNTTAANAIFLQCSATAWVVPMGWLLLNEKPDGRTLVGVALALLGIVWIVSPELLGNGGTGHGLGMILGLASGVAYASVVIGLRACREDNSLWLSCWNNLAGAVLLAMVLTLAGFDVMPHRSSVLSLAVFGTLQMALPYAFFARGLQSTAPAQATLIALAEPILNPIWVWIGNGERPHQATVIGGGLMLVGVLVANARFGRKIPERTAEVRSGRIETD